MINKNNIYKFAFILAKSKKTNLLLLKIFIIFAILINKYNSNEIKKNFIDISNNTTDLHPNSNIIKSGLL